MISDRPKELGEEVLSRLPATSLGIVRSACKKRKTLSKDRSFTKKHLAPTKKERRTKVKKKKKLTDLPRDLTEEVLSKLPITSLRGFRAVCKEWNTLSKDLSFTRKHIAQAKAAAAREFTVVMVMDGKVYLMSINLDRIHNGVDPSLNLQGKLACLYDSDQVDISTVYHCDGLVLCITKDYTRFVVWNPYWGQTLSLKARRLHRRPHLYRFAIGYQNSKSCRSYKILRFVDVKSYKFLKCEICDLDTNSWKVIYFTTDWIIHFYARGVSIKGNTYWFAEEKNQERRLTVEIADFLICFDFTTERFGPRLRLPFYPHQEETVTLSSVRDEQLAVLFQRGDNLHLEIWVTTRIEPQVVSWSKFLAVDMQPLTDFQFGVTRGSFFIDEEKKVVVVFAKEQDYYINLQVRTTCHNSAYIIGKDGYFREVDLGETSGNSVCPLGCSYIPSSVQIKNDI